MEIEMNWMVGIAIGLMVLGVVGIGAIAVTWWYTVKVPEDYPED